MGRTRSFEDPVTISFRIERWRKKVLETCLGKNTLSSFFTKKVDEEINARIKNGAIESPAVDDALFSIEGKLEDLEGLKKQLLEIKSGKIRKTRESPKIREGRRFLVFDGVDECRKIIPESQFNKEIHDPIRVIEEGEPDPGLYPPVIGQEDDEAS